MINHHTLVLGTEIGVDFYVADEAAAAVAAVVAVLAAPALVVPARSSVQSHPKLVRLKSFHLDGTGVDVPNVWWVAAATKN